MVLLDGSCFYAAIKHLQMISRAIFAKKHKKGPVNAVLTGKHKEGLRKLLDFEIPKHSRYNLDSKRLKLIEDQIYKIAKQLLEN